MTGMIIGAIVGIIAVSIIGYFVLRAMKGNMKLELSQKAVSSGEKIAGNLIVTVKKSILADRLYVGLIGEREERERGHGDDRDTVKWVEFFRDEADILMDEQLFAGFQQTYAFELDAPSESQVMTKAGAVLNAVDSMPDGTAKSVISGIGKVVAASSDHLRGRKRWKVISRLETKGVDLAASQKIHVSLKSA